MGALVIEKDVGAEGAQELSLVESAEKQCFVNADVPGAQRPDDALVRRCAASRDQRRADRARLVGEIALDAVQAGQEFLERSARQRAQRGVCLAAGKLRQPVLLINPLRL